MAKASAMNKGMQVTVRSGDYEGHTATVIDPVPIPDGGDHRAGIEHQRKVLVALDDIMDVETDTPYEVYILPRLLDLGDTTAGSFVNHTGGLSPMPRQAVDAAALTFVEDGTLISAEPITDPMDPALDRFRPNVNLVKQYISRQVPGGYTDVEYLLHLRDQRNGEGYSPNVAMIGETQSGKTMLVQVLAILAAERDGLPKPYPVFTINGGSGVTNYDLFGQTSAVIINGREVLVWMEGLVPMAARCGGFLYLDEFNAVPPSQGVAIHGLLDDRRQFVNTQKAVPDGHGGFSPEVVKAHTNLWTLVTINPNYKGTQSLQEATANRFRWMPWDYDEDVEKALIPSKTVRIMGQNLRAARQRKVVTVPVGTSALQRFNADCATFGVDNALWSFLGLFPPQERVRVQTIMEDGGLLDLLHSEYPNPDFKSGDDGEVVGTSTGATWQPDSLAQQV